MMGTGIGVCAGCAVATRGVQQRNAGSALLSIFTIASSTLFGAGFGIQQVVRGTLGTYEALKNSFFGDAIWDETLGKWVTVDLSRDSDSIPQTNADLDEKARDAYNTYRRQEEEESEESGNGADSDSKVEHHKSQPPESDDSLYRLLGVTRDATTAEIKKAYRVMALTQHPDKCGNTEESRVNFQKLSEAYTILSNPATREEYDHLRVSYDPSGTTTNLVSTNSGNPLLELVRLPFAEPLIGPLAITLLITPFHFYTSELRREAQHRREVRVAANLSRYLDNINGLQSLQVVVQDTCASPCGPSILRWVAQEYKSASRQFFLRAMPREIDEFLSNSWHTIQLWWSYWGVLSKLRGGLSTAEDADGENFRSILSAVSETNIRLTVRQATKMVLHDQSVSLAQRSERAKKLGMVADKIYEVLATERD